MKDAETPKPPNTLQQAVQYFSDEQRCIDAVAGMRWPNGAWCPDCFESGGNPYWIKSQKRWKCRNCRRQFSVKVGTLFEDSPISLTKWMPALWMLCNCKNGVSSWEIHRALGVTQKTAWFMLHRLRLALKEQDLGTKLGGSGSEVEADETYVGGKMANMHKKRRINFLGGVRNKVAVMGLLDRDAKQVRAQVLPRVKKSEMESVIKKNVKFGSTLYTDEHTGYDDMKYKYEHDTVVHSLQKYVNGRVHTNGIENFWSLLKRGINGTYVAVEPCHLFRYVDEQVFRYNNRATKNNPLNDADRFWYALSQVANKRITWKELTGKEEALQEAF